LSEARALNALFTDKMPVLSSVKGAFGHSLAAAGAIEAVVSAISVSDHIIPANTGSREPDPELQLNPLSRPKKARLGTVLSNSFGFGGNNASVIIGTPRKYGHSAVATQTGPMTVVGSACITGAGDTKKTMAKLCEGESCKGMLSLKEVSENLSPGKVRRLKRFPRLAMSLAVSALDDSGRTETPSSIFLGTGWGALSETFDFLTRLYETDEQFPSPTDFVGSVHNSPAGQVAMLFQSTGANVTTTGGDYSFEQSLMTAGLLSEGNDNTFLVIGADEGHDALSGLFDGSVLPAETLSDGGGALCLTRGNETSGLNISLEFYENTENNPHVISSLIHGLGGPKRINNRYGMLLLGIPAAFREKGDKQLREFLSLAGFEKPVIDYRKLTGEFASASAVAAVMAVSFLKDRTVPGRFFGGKDLLLNGKGVLVMGLGNFITAMEVMSQ
ncbi:MAG: 3-oxoacyl-ACP synthase, partial [Deltaproteobacteria bacterium]|nr:3-oxoacyl-ACP synthase [Deltaproteobacteria bacterium]